MYILKSLPSNSIKNLYHRASLFCDILSILLLEGISIGNLGMEKNDYAKMLYFPSNILKEHQGTIRTLERFNMSQ